MKDKFYKNAKVEQLTKVVLSNGEEKGLIVKDPCNIKMEAVKSKQNIKEVWK